MERYPTTSEPIIVKLEEQVPTTSGDCDPSTISDHVPSNTGEVIITSADPVPSNTGEVIITSADPVPSSTGEVIISTSVDHVPSNTGDVILITSADPVPSNTGEVIITSADLVPSSTGEVIISTSADPVPSNTGEVIVTTSVDPVQPTSGVIQPSSGAEIPPTKGGQILLTSGVTTPSTSGQTLLSAKGRPLTPDREITDSSETDTAEEGGSSTDTSFSGDDYEQQRKRPRLSNLQNIQKRGVTSTRGVPVPSTSSKYASLKLALPNLSRRRHSSESSETDTADESNSSTETANASDDESEQSRKRLRVTGVQYDPTSSDPVLPTSDGLAASVSAELQRSGKENVDSPNEDISGDSNISKDSSNSLPGDEQKQEMMTPRENIHSPRSDSIPPPRRDSVIVNPVSAKTGDPVPSTSAIKAPSTSVIKAPSTSRDPGPSTSGQFVHLGSDEETDFVIEGYSRIASFFRRVYNSENGIDSCEESPDEEHYSQVEETERVLEEKTMMESVQTAVASSQVAISDSIRISNYALHLKEKTHDKTMGCLKKTDANDVRFAQVLNSHIQIYRNVYRRWEGMYLKILERIEIASALKNDLQNRLRAIEDGSIDLNEANEIYDTIDDLNRILKYLEILLKKIIKRGDFLNKIKNKIMEISE